MKTRVKKALSFVGRLLLKLGLQAAKSKVDKPKAK